MAYADAAVGGIAADHRKIAHRARARSASGVPLGGLLLGVLLVVGAVALLARTPVPNTGSAQARTPASSCAAGDWPATTISCDAVFRIGNQAGAQVERAYWIALSRGPTTGERGVGVGALTELAAEWAKTAKLDADAARRKALATYCHALVNSAAFMYVD